MLYLAEVQKKSGVFGGGKADLKLLAFQRGESWSAVQGEDIVQFDGANDFKDGAFVFADLSANKQVQKVQSESARQLVSILQNFSRIQERYKNKEEEIEQWKESLKYQSEVLQQREEEMQGQLQQLEQMPEELERLEQQRQEMERTREEADRLQAEVNKKQQEIEQASEQLRQRQEEQGSSSAGQLDEGMSGHLRELLDYLSGTAIPIESLREPLSVGSSAVAEGLGIIEEKISALEQQRSEAQQQLDDANRRAEELQRQWQEWHEGQGSLEESRSNLKVQENMLEFKQSLAETLERYGQEREEIKGQLEQVTAGSSTEANGTSDKVDVAALENMPLEQLQEQVQTLKQDLEKVFRFVHVQEEELTLQRQTIEELLGKLASAPESQRSSLEKELADEQENYKFLNETLVGQRRNLQEREEILQAQQAIVWRRLGNAPGAGQGQQIDIGPVLEAIEARRQKEAEELESLKGEIGRLEQAIAEAKDAVGAKESDQETRLQELKESEQQLGQQRQAAAELSGQVKVSEEMLHPLQEKLGLLREKLEVGTGATGQIEETSNYQQEAIANLRSALEPLLGQPSAEEVAAS